MPFEKGKGKTGGRQKGVKNKVGLKVKESIQAVYEKLGGDEGFSDWATAEKTEFYKIYARLIPTDVEHSGDIKIIVNKNVDD
jgi:hypothetical protein